MKVLTLYKGVLVLARHVFLGNVLIIYEGFNLVQKLPTNKFLKKQKIYNGLNRKIYIKIFLLEPITRKTRLIFHYLPLNVTIHYIHAEVFINPLIH